MAAGRSHLRVFERFVHLGSTALPGSGLGLSIVRRIAERHGADIVLGAGLQGRGLAVTVVFPAAWRGYRLRDPIVIKRTRRVRNAVSFCYA